MKLKILLLLPHILSSFVVSGINFVKDLHRTSLIQQKFENATLKAICTVSCPNKSEECINDCNRKPRSIIQLDIEAAANSKFVCREGTNLMMNQNPGTFVIERLLPNGTTEDVFVHDETLWYEALKVGNFYKYRLYRVTPDGISKPEVTDWFRGMNVFNDVPMPVSNLKVKFMKLNVTIPDRISAEISFDPSEGDTRCLYQATCRQEKGDYNRVKRPEYGEYKIRFDDLPLASNFTVSIEAEAWTPHPVEASLAFITPANLTDFQVGGNLPQDKIVIIACVVGAIVLSIGIVGFVVYWLCRVRKPRLIQSEFQHVEVDEYEIEPERLTITRDLGNGAFGVVKYGILRGDQDQTTAVAVKMTRNDRRPADSRNLELEIKMLKALGKHPNIVSFVGCCTTGPQPLLVVEYCSRGDLQSFLRAALLESKVLANKTEKLVTLSPTSFGPDETFGNNSGELLSHEVDKCVPTFRVGQDATAKAEVVTMLDMLNYGRQIATGMEFLSSQRIVHRDLATRNVVVCDDRTVKISDFGLSRDVYLESVYVKRGTGRMPLKWMAIEALTHQVFSTSSDVWSFGVLLWEIVTLGGDPYPGIPMIDILKFLISGYRMERPSSCIIPLYDLMMSCWEVTPEHRPSFGVLRQELDWLISLNTDSEYLDLNDAPKKTSPGRGFGSCRV